MLKQFKPLNMFTKQTDELKELIAKYPNYPIVVLVDSEVVADDDYGWWYAPEIRFDIGEILDCEQDINNEKVYVDRDEFEEDLANILGDSGDYDEITDEEFDTVVKTELLKYEPYWRKVIQIYADV
jgi:hypothetical protein